jgi:hypothetical protein
MTKAEKEFFEMMLKEKKQKLAYLQEQHRTAIAVYEARRQMIMADIDVIEHHLKG